MLYEEFSETQFSPHLSARSARKRSEPSEDSRTSPWLMRPGVLFARVVVVVLPLGTLGFLVEEVCISLLEPDILNGRKAISEQLIRTLSNTWGIGACDDRCRLVLAVAASWFIVCACVGRNRGIFQVLPINGSWWYQ